MTTLTDTQVVTASGGLVELGHTDITSAVTVTSTTGQNIGGSVTAVCDGSPVVVEMFCPYTVVGGIYLVSSLYVDGSFQQRTSIQVNGTQPMYAKVRLTPSAGTHTFQWKALVNTSSATMQFDTAPTTNGGPGFLRVSKIVQATQWPAVTTGTIICTSTTRPASPFSGQKIYETDTKKELTYDGTSWTQPWNQPWGLVGVGTHNTGAGVSSGVSICSVTFTAVTDRMYLASYVSRTIWSGASATVGIYDNNTGLRIAEDYGAPNPVVLQRAKTFSAGSRTLSIRQDGATSMTPISGSYSGHERPAQLVVRDIGPA